MNDAVGFWFAAVTVTDFVAVSVAPELSVTFRVTVYVPAFAYVCESVAPDPVELSP